MNRIILITYFKKEELNKIYENIKYVNYHLCKFPYGINDNKRYKLDNLPYYFTIFATNKENETKLLKIANKIKITKINLKINEIKVMNGKNNSYVLYFGIENNKYMKKLQKLFYEEFHEEKYNPNTFLFHMTLHIDKNKNTIYKLLDKLKENFTPFYLEFNELALFDYPGNIITTIKI